VFFTSLISWAGGRVNPITPKKHFFCVRHACKDEHDISELKDEVLQNNIFYTCPDFITFIYYTWVENLAWFSAEEGDGEDFQAEAVKEFIKNYKEKQNKS